MCFLFRTWGLRGQRSGCGHAGVKLPVTFLNNQPEWHLGMRALSVGAWVQDV